MLLKSQILVRALALVGFAASLAVAISACGQKGGLYLPTDAAAANRATLPQTLRPGASNAAPAPMAPSVVQTTVPASTATSTFTPKTPE